MRKLRFMLSMVLLATMLSGCLIPVGWDDGYGYGYGHDGGYRGGHHHHGYGHRW